jgi:aldehyde dehydrogenase (NAD+)
MAAMTQVATRGLYIDGGWVNGGGDEILHVVNPATEELIATVPQATPADIDLAVGAARRAFDEGPWPRMRPVERAAVLSAMAAEFDRRRAELVELNITEAGSTRMLSEFLQVGTPIDHFTDLAERVLPSFDFEQPVLPVVGHGIGQGVVVREPYGVAALITAFNFPFLLNLAKIGPALAAGCTAVLKCSPYTPLEALVIGEIAETAGLPAGVLNIVTGGVAAGEALTRHPGVDIISFTGSDTVGRKVYAQGAETLKKVVLELGGKSANIILPDADLQKAVAGGVQACFLNSGQSCDAPTRMFVQRAQHDQAVAIAKAAAEATKAGDPNVKGTSIGPVVNEAQFRKIQRLIETGIAEGATLVAGGPGRPEGLNRGYYVRPTVFANVKPEMTIAREEIFGPVLSILPYDSEEQVIRMANDTVYGLSGYVQSSDLDHARRVAAQLRTGQVRLNGAGPDFAAPFGGYKQSGNGREWGEFGLEEFLETKAIIGYAA